MATFTMRSPLPASAEEVYAWYSRPGAFLRLQPPWESVQVVGTEGRFGTAGHRVTVRTPMLGPIHTTWVAELFDFEPGRGFKDRQLKGPFAEWLHIHRFIPDGPNSSFCEDEIHYRLPMGGLGRLFGGGMVKKRLEKMFTHRHALTASDLRRHVPFRDRPRMKIAITGSRGFVGSELVLFLLTGGHSVVRLVSGKVPEPPPDDGTQYVAWDPQAPLDPAVLDGCDAVIHLAGDNIGDGRWTASKKKRILESRSIPTRHLANALASLPPERQPKVLVSASGISITGDVGDEIRTEDSTEGKGFLADVCRAWEAATEPAASAGVRVVKFRLGIVLSPQEGALGKQLFAFKAGAGAVLGSGQQWLPWITRDDLIGALHFCLMNETIQGPVNAVGPNPVTNHTFTKTLGRVLSRPAFFWLPEFALKAAFGQIANEALLASTRAVPQKLLESGFAFEEPELEKALSDMLGR